MKATDVKRPVTLPTTKTELRETRAKETAPPPAPSADEPNQKAAALIDAGQRAVPTHGMTGPSSWLAARMPADDVKRRTLRTLAKLVDTTPIDTSRLLDLARVAKESDFGAIFAQVLSPHAPKVVAATLDGAYSLSDVGSALELLREAMPAEVWPALVDAVVPRVREEVTSLGALSDEIMKIPRAADGRATSKAVERTERELLPRVKALRGLLEVCGIDLHALLSTTEGATKSPTPQAKKVLDAAARATGREVSVHVSTRVEAEAVLEAWLGREALVDTSEMSPTLVKHLLGRTRTFHWDDTYGPNGIITGHYAGSDHGLLPHLQIHTADGREVRVFFPKKFGKEST